MYKIRIFLILIDSSAGCRALQIDNTESGAFLRVGHVVQLVAGTVCSMRSHPL